MEALLAILLITALLVAWVLWRRLVVVRAERDALRSTLHGQQHTPLPEVEQGMETAWCATPFLDAALEERARTEFPRPSPMLEALRRESQGDV
jgi:hypothetical protein